MSKAAVFFSEGYEEVEALTAVDLLRRADIDVTMVSVEGTPTVAGSHDIVVQMNQDISQVDWDSMDILILPGGLKGTEGLESNGLLMEKLDEFYRSGRYIAAICAAPSIFGHRGYLKGRRATSYPSFESHLEGAVATHAPAEVDGNVITGRGMGCSIPFALAIVKELAGEEPAEKLAAAIVFEG